MQGIGAGMVAIVAGIIGLAIVAVVVSKNAQTSSVLTSGGTALSSIITAAVSPVATGNTFGAVGSGATGGL
jgi:hypothetical protein